MPLVIKDWVASQRDCVGFQIAVGPACAVVVSGFRNSLRSVKQVFPFGGC